MKNDRPLELHNANLLKALAEHHAISKTSNSRGLKIINTDRAGVPMRYMLSNALATFGFARL